ncbi:MAG TPA: hypothetical protein VFR27_15345 [Mycobacterium sp.]|nr:hypothetical protein [Mycobacterium sp.]
MRYRFDVVGPNVLDIVRSAGGWLYDRATAGWDVTVLIPGLDADSGQALRILGARTMDLASVLTQWEQRPHPQTIAVSAEMFAHHAEVRHGVLEALKHSRTEVTLWGAVPAELDRDVDLRQHRLSAAARAFKTQALIGAMRKPAEPVAAPAGTEMFRCGVAACPSVAADLSPAS